MAEIAIAIEEEVQTTTTIATEEQVQTTKASVSSNESIHSDDVEATGNWLSSLRGASIGIIGILGLVGAVGVLSIVGIIYGIVKLVKK